MFEKIISIVSILSAFIVIGINEILTHKRDKKHKKNELLLSHLKETLEWLNTMQQDIFSLSRKLITMIGIYSDHDKKEQLSKEFSIEANEMVEKSIVLCNSYAEINSGLGIDLELNELKNSIAQYVDKLRQIRKEYSFPDEDNKDLDEVNHSTSIIQEQIKKRISIISKEISKILMN